MKFRFSAVYLLLIIGFLSFSGVASAQTVQKQTPSENLPNPYEIFQKYVKQNNYITPLFELKRMEDKYFASPMWKEPYLDVIIYLEGYLGDYKKAYDYENIFYETNRSYRRAKADFAKDIASSPLGGYKMLDPLETIERIADARQVIMINEEHRTPFHRATTLQLLSRLYKKGFRYFAAETLYAEDAELQKRGYPVQSTGFYTADPLYADVVRTALKLGYKVVPYDSFPKGCQSPAENPEFCNNVRERAQAQNLYDRILKDDPQAKIFVHVGRGHNLKYGDEKFSYMAKHFQEITGINPFTIDQVAFSERGDTANEYPLYRFLIKNNILEKPSVYQASDGVFYNKGAGLGNDMVIFHPRMKYENGRATFLKMNGLRRAEKINLKKLKLRADKNLFRDSDPVLIQAFYAKESADAVPIDQIILYPNKEIPVLMLPAGKFRIRAMNKSGKVTAQYERKSK